MLLTASCATTAENEPVHPSVQEIDLNRSGLREFIFEDGSVYKVEFDRRTIRKLKNDSLVWEADVFRECDEPRNGRKRIRYIRATPSLLTVIYGKNSEAKIVTETGNVICLGED